MRFLSFWYLCLFIFLLRFFYTLSVVVAEGEMLWWNLKSKTLSQYPEIPKWFQKSRNTKRRFLRCWFQWVSVMEVERGCRQRFRDGSEEINLLVVLFWSGGVSVGTDLTALGRWWLVFSCLFFSFLHIQTRVLEWGSHCWVCFCLCYKEVASSKVGGPETDRCWAY